MAREVLDIALPMSARAGSCSSCAGRLPSGSVNQMDQAFLDEDEHAADFVLTCEAKCSLDCSIDKHAEKALDCDAVSAAAQA